MRVSSMAAVLLLLGGPAWAHGPEGGTEGCPHQGQQGQMQQGQMMNPQGGAEGMVQGIVQRSNVPRGTLQVLTGDGLVTLRAKPGQIMSFRNGDVVRIGFSSFGGQKWVVSYLGGQGSLQASAQPFAGARGGGAMGTVSSVNRGAGRITISFSEGQRTFQAHPNDIAAVSPGESVNVRFVRVGNNDWVSAIRPQAPPPQSRQQPGESDDDEGEDGD